MEQNREDFTERMREKEANNKFVVHNFIKMVSVKRDEAERLIRKLEPDCLLVR